MQLKEKLHKSIDPKLGWFIVIVVAILFSIWTSSYVNKKAEEVYVDPYVNNSAEQSTPAVKPASSGSMTISYQKALVKYANRRLQFDNACQASPNNVTYKNGTSIMLDNRSKQARTIKVGEPYSLAAYGFKIITLSSGSLPAKYLVDCGKSQNVATVLLQK